MSQKPSQRAQRLAGRRRVAISRSGFIGEDPDPRAQEIFLHTVARCVPEAMRALETVAPGDDARLRIWASAYGFTDHWALRTAEAHVTFWRDAPEFRGRWAFVSGATWVPVLPTLAPRDHLKESQAEFKVRLRAFEQQMRTPPGLRRAPTPEARHFEWLALHHVGRWTYDRIAERYQTRRSIPDRPEISDAMKAIAVLVGVTLRPGRGRKLATRRAIHRQQI